jgi:flagellar protein FliO/FliZ
MTQTLVLVAVFVFLLALTPMVVKWLKQRSFGGIQSVSSASRILSVLAVGPHQRVVTVEVGPEGHRVWLTLGVTAQSITCLHSMPLASGSAPQTPLALGQAAEGS